VLNRTPIVNLPKIGRSAFLDIFFFSPLKVVASPKDLIRELRRIDPGISTHPMKIYEVDPFDSISSALGNDRDFLQAMRYFENLSFDSSQIGDLNFGQVLSVLEQSQVSLKEIINELPVTELSSDISEGEKAIIKRIYDGFTKAKKGYSIFQIVGKEGQIKKKIRGLTKAELCGDQEIGAVFSGLKTAVQARKRLLVIAEELNSNVKALNTSLA
jgi:hypothetical protein